MPTYEYACKNCGHRVEVVQSMSEEPLRVCGVCGGELRKVFHPAGVLFKGSGFYSTDKRGSPKTASSESKGGEGSSKGDADGKKPSSATPSKDGRDAGGAGADPPKRPAESGGSSSKGEAS